MPLSSPLLPRPGPLPFPTRITPTALDANHTMPTRATTHTANKIRNTTKLSCRTQCCCKYCDVKKPYATVLSCNNYTINTRTHRVKLNRKFNVKSCNNTGIAVAGCLRIGKRPIVTHCIRQKKPRQSEIQPSGYDFMKDTLKMIKFQLKRVIKFRMYP